MHADPETFGGVVSLVGPTALPRPTPSADATPIRDIDMAAVEITSRGARRLLAIGESKAHSTRVGPALLDRLDRTVAALQATPPKRVAVDQHVRRLIASKSGFTTELRRIADRRPDVELVDLHRLYHGT